MAEKDSIKLVITFAERGMGKELARLYERQGVCCGYQCRGLGTASSDLLDLLGIGTTEKDILINLAPKAKAERLLYGLDHELLGAVPGKGIVFDMPLTGLNNMIAQVLLNSMDGGTGGVRMESKTDHSLILVAVNQGHTDAVMDTARQAGAGGGTVIRARWAGGEDVNQFYGISVQSEKEIIAIVADGNNRNTIMEIINKKHGLKTEAGAVVLSVAIDHMVRLA